MFLYSGKVNDCCGCMACSKACPVSAITMKVDEKGFLYPCVDEKTCLNCGLCVKTCPMEENYVGKDFEPSIYAVRCRDENVLNESSSGGMFSLLTEWVLDKNGVIYGVSFDEGFYVQHCRAVTWEQAKRFRTSKYVESDLTKVYENICDDLKSGKIVLLTGTPCQISSLNKFLKLKRVPVDHLYTCDNICHGVPSRMLWKEYIDILKDKYIAKDDEIIHINMRSKKVSWKKQVMDIGLKKGNIEGIIEKFSFNRFFLSLYGIRPSCFQCKYTSYKRPSDFTLGDFWNVEQAGIFFDTNGGVNVVLVNTDKGKKVFEQIAKCADVQQVTKKAAWQPHLEYSSKPPKHQEEFWREYLSGKDKEKVLRKYMKGSFLTKMIRFFTPFLRKTGLYAFAGKVYKKLFVGI